MCFRYAHCINLEFYEDIVNVLNRLLEREPLGYREQLHCIQTVFTILSGQGEVLHIDPFRFYVHLYRNLLSVHAGNFLITFLGINLPCLISFYISTEVCIAR